MANQTNAELYRDVVFFSEAKRFRASGDNAASLRKWLVKLGHEDQAELLDKIQRLKRPTQLVPVDYGRYSFPNVRVLDDHEVVNGLQSGPLPNYGGKQLSTVPFHFGTIKDESVDAVAWLESLGALRIDKHFQCHWAACTMVVTTDGWSKDTVVRRGRRWEVRPPELLRASFLLYWQDQCGVFHDWKRHLHRLAHFEAINAVNEFTRARIGFQRLIDSGQGVKMEFVNPLSRFKFKDDADGQ